MNFNLSVKKIDFIETFPFILERDEKYLQPYQLHKSMIKGKLVSADSQNSRFETLVFKYANDVEQKLVINIDNPSLRPFMSHTIPLPKKCGSDVMEWGWLSFISKTNDQRSAKKQQCIFDYFEDSKDENVKELFVNILGATSSILSYLEKNVEP